MAFYAMLLSSWVGGFGVWTDVVYFRIFSKIYNILW